MQVAKSKFLERMQELATETRRPLVLSLCMARASSELGELEALNLNFGLLATSILALEVEQLQGSTHSLQCPILPVEGK